MNIGNFRYDKLGQLTEDASEEIQSIEWRKGDKKMASLTRTASSSLPDLEFKYNPFGLRILKIEKTKSSPGFYAPAEEWNYTYYTYDANGQTMAVYDLEISETNNQARMEEHHLYGASRLGMLKEGELIFDNGPMAPVTSDIYQNELGDRRYELTNHLGNVQAVITDRRTWNATDVNYEAVVVMTSDYYPFGMQMPERHEQYAPNADYRYAYNGMEVDNEVSGNGNSYTTEFRQYDPRLGRWKSLDPLMEQFPSQSPYCAFDNNPVYYTDVKGAQADPPPKGLPVRPKEENMKKVFTADDGKQYIYQRFVGGNDGEWIPASCPKPAPTRIGQTPQDFELNYYKLNIGNGYWSVPNNWRLRKDPEFRSTMKDIRMTANSFAEKGKALGLSLS